jgi:hypothetical protein
MVWSLRLLVAFTLVLAPAAVVRAQAPAASQSEPEPTLKDRLKEPDQAGGIHFTEHFGMAFGGIKQGSGVAIGPAVSHKFRDGGFTQLKAVYSIKKFVVLQARYDTRKFWSDRAIVISRLRWQKAPELSLYRLGPDSPNARVEYGERKSEGNAVLAVKLQRIRIGGGFGIERYATSGGRIDLSEGEDELPAIPPVPGLATQPWFAHAYGSLGWDGRDSPDYNRTGFFAEGAIHDYHDWHDGQDSFRRFDGTIQQLFPTFGGRGVVDLSGRTWLSQATGTRSVPFFLMPTLGGGDLLRAFPSYRFRDRNSLLLKAEYRWAVHEMADVAGIYETGEVAPTAKAFAAEHLEHSVAIGLRVHSKSTNLFRVDLAHGREGFGLRLGFTKGGAY